ncbi:hypothetical protein [Methanobrevibacter sp.]|uniref:hypothetical protein n=1 Tax=Methanobrevibacter sp. TaxID=66852 RepID=UPI0025ED68AF|nr:hypothetical protein [Methanobrevibacter sp.]MBR4447960.1 hypothetical protein [Methanobrevibacter sp.]
MKIKHLIIVSLILAILTIGAVSASENITSDDQLAVEEDVDVQETPQEDVLSDSLKKSDFHVDFTEIIAVNSKDNVIDIYEQTVDGVNGNLTVSVGDNEPVYNKKFDYEATLTITDLGITSPGIYNIHANFIPVNGNSIVLLDDTLNVTEKEGYGDMTVNIYSADYNPGWDDDEYNLLADIYDMPSSGTVLVYIDGDLCYNGTGEYIFLNDLNKKPSIGRHYVKVSFWNGKNETVVKSRMIYVGYHFYVGEHDDEFYLGEDAELCIILPNDAKGDIYVTVNGKTQKISHKKGQSWVNYVIKTNSLKLNKKYKFHMELRNDPFYPFKTYEFEFSLIPHISYFDMGVGENGYVTINLPEGYKGTLKLYNTKDGKYDKVKSGKAIKTVKVKNGKASIPISYSKKGEKNFIIEYVDGKYVYSQHCYFFVYKNDKKFSSSISSNKIKFNKKVVVKLKGPKTFKKRFYIYVDGKYLKSVKLNKKGVKKVSIKFKSSGKHSIKVITDQYSSKFYSNTFTIKVKQPDVKLTLKKITLKKPMKKVTLKSTLKIKGKAKKGLKVKFKFNKKSYKAKTNKKGIAKVTVKKSVLKKLKVGQTVKYQVKYGKTVTTQSTKVKN